MKDIILTQFAATTDTPSINQIGDNKYGDETTLASNVTGIINAFIGALGIVAVIIIIIGGINYMTSSGDAAKVKKAKDTILYGVIGLVICVLAFAIVNFIAGNLLAADSGE